MSRTPFNWILKVAVPHESEDCLLWPFGRTVEGYGRIRCGSLQTRAHRVVCEIAHGPPPYGMTHAAHRCGIPLCVNKRHVRWATPLENAADTIGHGMCPRGERNGKAKLTKKDVHAIRQSPLRNKDLSKIFNVDPSAISHIRRGATWRHV